MDETLEYIESYFENRLNEAERKAFEEQIVSNKELAQEVAFYIQARQVLQQELVKEKIKEWQPEKEDDATKTPVISLKKSSSAKIWLAIAAGLLIILTGSLFFLFSKSDNATQLAKAYSDSAFDQLSLSMGSQDSLQMGIDAYNQGRLAEANAIFTQVYTHHPDTIQALEYMGIVSLKQKEYDKAYTLFGQLASHKELFVNSGNFYQAIVLLIRSKSGDKDQAKRLLEQVLSSENSDNKDKARQILNSLQ